MEVREDDEEYKNPVDRMFKELEAREPNHFAVRQYKKYSLAAGVVCFKRLLNQSIGKSLKTYTTKQRFVQFLLVKRSTRPVSSGRSPGRNQSVC